MKELRLKFVAIDDWNRPVFQNDKGLYFGDTEIFSITAPEKKRFTVSIKTKN